MTESSRVEKFEESSVLISGFLTNLLHRPLLPSLWRNRFWVLRSEGILYCYRHASSKNSLLRIDLTDPSIRIRTGEPVSELRGVKWPRAVHNERKLCILVRKKRHFYYTADSTHLSAWDEALHSVADKYAFSSNWTLGSQKAKLVGEEGPAMSVQDMRGGDGRGVETEDKEAILESYRHRKSAMARAQLATLFGAQPSPSLSRVHNYGDPGEMEPLVQRVQRLSDASSTVVTLRRRPAESREVEKSIQSPVDEHGPFTFQPRAGSPVLVVSERQRKTSHSQPKPTQAGLVLSKKREEEEEEKNFMKKMERFRQLATQHELPMRTAGDLQRINRKPSRIRIPDQFMRPIDTPPPSPPPHGPRLVPSSSNLASIKERMQPVGPGRHSPYMQPRSTARRPPPQVDHVIPPPHAFLASKDVSQEVILLQEESLNELRQVLSNFSGPEQESDIPQDQEPSSEKVESDPPSEDYLAKKRPSFASKRMESIKVAESLDEVRPSQAWRRVVPSVPSKSPLAVEAPFTFSQLDTADTSIKTAVDSPDTTVNSTATADSTIQAAVDFPNTTADKLPDATRSLPTMSSAKTDVIKGEDPSEEARQDRVQIAVDWVSGEVEKMINEILSLGRIGPGGQTQIEFGYLFAETANKFDALSGILKTAKKLGVISYEGEVLFQGVNDKTVITLLKGDIGDIKKETFIRTPPVSPRVPRAGGSPPGKHRKFGTGTQQYGLNKCAVCGKQVYQVEYVGATDKAFHRWCFRCCVCQDQLIEMPRIDQDLKLDFRDVLLRPKRSTLKSRSDVQLERSYIFRNSKQNYEGVPIIASNMDTVGTFEMADALSRHKCFTTIDKHFSLEEWITFSKKSPEALPYVAVTSGTGKGELENLRSILNSISEVQYICLDVANGYSEHFVEFVKLVRSEYPKHTIMAGNVVTGEMVEELILSGADIIKVGIGQGSVCTTRIKTGVGYPQLSAVLECADAAHGLGGHIISDGGCVCPGDVAKAFGAGADFVMLGGMFAGHEQSGGKLVERDGKKYRVFYGMSSGVAHTKHSGGVPDYATSEGKEVEVPYRGDVSDTIKDILGGVRSACTYVGAAKLKEISKRTTFIRVSSQFNTVFGADV